MVIRADCSCRRLIKSVRKKVIDNGIAQQQRVERNNRSVYGIVYPFARQTLDYDTGKVKKEQVATSRQ